MATRNHNYTIDLDKPLSRQNMGLLLATGDSNGDVFNFDLTRSGKAETLSGTVTVAGYFVRNDAATVAMYGSYSGNRVSVILPASCYVEDGYFTLAVRVTAGGAKTTIAVIDGYIRTTTTDTLIDPGSVVPTLDDVLNQIAEMEAVTAEGEATIAAIKADAAAAIKTTNEATAAANTATVELAKTAGVPVVLTRTGSIVTITDGAERPAVSLISHIEPVQEGSGDPSPDNVRPISGWHAVIANTAGSNLFGGNAMADKLVAVAGASKDSAAGIVSFTAQGVSGKTLASEMFKENTAYTIILYGRNSEPTSAATNFVVRYTNGSSMNLEFATRGADSYCVFTTDGNKTVQGINGAWYTSTTYLYYGQCGIFEGAVDASQFAPYQGQTLTASLPETVYGGTLDWGTGVLTVDSRFIEFDGTEIWHMDTTEPWVGENGNGFYTILADNYGRRDAVPVCNAYKGYTRAEINTSGENAVCMAGIGEQIEFAKTQFSTVAEWTANISKLKAAGKPVQVAYKLATPYTIQLTPQQLDTLKGTNNVWSDCGNTDLTYIADTQLYIDQRLAALLNA